MVELSQGSKRKCYDRLLMACTRWIEVRIYEMWALESKDPLSSRSSFGEQGGCHALSLVDLTRSSERHFGLESFGVLEAQVSAERTTGQLDWDVLHCACKFLFSPPTTEKSANSSSSKPRAVPAEKASRIKRFH